MTQQETQDLPVWTCQSTTWPTSSFHGETAHIAAERYALHFSALSVEPHKNYMSARVVARVRVYRPGETCYSTHDLVRFAGQFPSVQHVQARRVSTETRRDELARDLKIYEAMYDSVRRKHPQVAEFYGAPIHDIDGVKVTFWRTVKTKIGSLNYFTDGTISGDYFVVKGYTDAIGKPLPVVY